MALGKEKLKGLKKLNPVKKNEGIVATQILFPDQDASSGVISPDGRYLLYVDWTNEKLEPTIILHDLYNGTNRLVSKAGSWNAPIKFPNPPIWSPDGKQFAYYWYDAEEEGERNEFHITNIDGTNDKVVAKGSGAPAPLAWSTNGKYILCLIDEQIALYSVNDGSIRVIKSVKGLRLDKMDISHDNKYIVYSMRQKKGSEHNGIYLISIDGKVDKKIVSGTTFDFNPRWSPDGKNVLFISDRNGSNGLWKIRMENGHAVRTPSLVKANLGSLGSSTNILGITNEGSLYYGTTSSRTDIHLVKTNLFATTGINTSTRISNLNIRKNTNPAITSDGRYIAFVKWNLFPDEGVIGRPFLISIHDTKTGEIKDTNTYLYTLAQLYFYWPKPQWSPDEKKLLIQGRKKEKENILTAVFIYDTETEETEPIIVMPNYNEYTDIPSTGTSHVFSSDGKSIYYLSTDRKNIYKIELKSKKETIVFTNNTAMAGFIFSNDESKIVYTLYDSWWHLYVAPISGGTSKKIVSLNKNVGISLIGWDSNDTHFYFKDGGNSTIMRVSVEEGVPERVINLKDIFPDGDIREIVFDHSGSNMAVQVEVENKEIWKLKGVFNE